MKDLKSDLLAKRGVKPSDCSMPDLPLKLANYVVENYIEPISEDRFFKERADVRSEAYEKFKYVLGPWKGSTKESIEKILKNKANEQEQSAKEEEENKDKPGWYQWFYTSFEDYLNDAFTSDDQLITTFVPTEDDQEKLIFLLWKDFVERNGEDVEKQLITAHELARVSWDDVKWFIGTWLEKYKDKIPGVNEKYLQSAPPGCNDQDCTISTTLKFMKENFVKDVEAADGTLLQEVLASRLGTMLASWIKKSWVELYKRQNDKEVVFSMMKHLDL